MSPALTPRQQFEQKLAPLVEKFDRQRAHYLSTAYNETDVRAEFIDPLFEALGWDLNINSSRWPTVKPCASACSARQRAPQYRA